MRVVFGAAAVFVLGLTLSIPVAEAAFRVIGDAPSEDLRGLYVSFKNSYRLAPSVDTDAFWASGRVAVHTDTLGLRTDSARRFATAPHDRIDGLVVGDSQGFGNGVNFEDSLAGSLIALAADDGRRIRNLSVGGHSLATQMSLVQSLRDDHGVKISDLIVLLTPVMLTNCDQINTAVVGADGRLYADTVTPAIRLRLWMKTHLVIYSRIRDAIRDSGIGADPARTSPTIFEFYRNTSAGDAERKLYSCLQAAVTYASPRGMNVHAFYLPSTVEADFEPLRLAAARQGVMLDPDQPFNVYASVTHRLGMQTIDLRPTLISLRAEGQALNVIGDFHYSAALSRALSVSIWRALAPSLKAATDDYER